MCGEGGPNIGAVQKGNRTIKKTRRRYMTLPHWSLRIAMNRALGRKIDEAEWLRLIWQRKFTWDLEPLTLSLLWVLLG